MKYVISCIILFAMVIACNAQEDKKNTIMEKFDFETVDKYPGSINPIGIKRNGWTILMYRGYDNSDHFYYEYPPMPSYYWICKEFYPNGNIKAVKKLVGDYCLIGESIKYDENGNITEIVDHDAKLGKFKLEDIIKFIEKEGYINLETGAGLKGATIYEDGHVYRKGTIFDIGVIEFNGKECYLIPINLSPETTTYYLDKDTGDVLFIQRKNIYIVY